MPNKNLKSRALRLLLLAPAVLALGAGCLGAIESDAASDNPGGPGVSPAGSAGSPGITGPGSSGAAAAGGAGAPLPARVWRLTRAQYDNTVRDLLGDATAPAQKFVPEEGGTGFVNAELTLGFKDTNMADFNRAATRLAADAVATAARLETIFPCGEARLAEEACGQSFVTTFGRRAFRRPLTADEDKRYQGLFALAKQKLDARSAVQAVVQAMLLSPNFLFRSEVGDGKVDANGRVRLTAHEVAAALSYYLWNSPPDAELAQAADSGAILTVVELGRHARRLLDDPRAKAVVSSFFLELMDYRALEDVSKASPFSTPFKTVRAVLGQETSQFVQEVLWKDDGTLGKLLTAPYTTGNAELAAFYGASGPAAGAGFARFALDAKDRAGLLTQIGLLAATSHPSGTSPVLRGRFIAQQILCIPVPDPPENVVAQEPAASKTLTTRQRYEAHATQPSCAACHRVIDPPGVALEHLDPIGQVRRTENGVAIDTSGTLVGTKDADGPFSDVGALAKKLAASANARECMAKQVFRFATGRSETGGDQAALADTVRAFEKSGLKVKDLFLAHVLSDRFVIRVAN